MKDLKSRLGQAKAKFYDNCLPKGATKLTKQGIAVWKHIGEKYLLKKIPTLTEIEKTELVKVALRRKLDMKYNKAALKFAAIKLGKVDLEMSISAMQVNQTRLSDALKTANSFKANGVGLDIIEKTLKSTYADLDTSGIVAALKEVKQ